jgi:hypothetical protein
MQIKIQIDRQDLLRNLSEQEQTQLPFAMSLALNKTATLVQNTQRELMRKNFDVKGTWFIYGVRITKEDRANRTKQYVVISVLQDRQMTQRFEDGGFKTSNTGGLLVVPVRSVLGKLSRGNGLQFKNLHLHRDGNKVVGDKGTFMVKRPDGTISVRQRIGKGRSAKYRTIYRLLKRTRVPALLHFVDTATKVINDNYSQIFSDAMAQAMKTRKR